MEPNPTPDTCITCGEPLTYYGSGPRPKYCSRKCRGRSGRSLSKGDLIGPCADCGEPVIYKGIGPHPAYCSARCMKRANQRRAAVPKERRPKALCAVTGCPNESFARGWCEKHYRRWRNTGDPELVRKSGPKPRSDRRYVHSNGYVIVAGGLLEHRVVMEQILGRPLVKGENVHHINGVKHDNRPENLEVWVTPQPCGQRPEDLVDWVIETYPDLVRQAMESSA